MVKKWKLSSSCLSNLNRIVLFGVCGLLASSQLFAQSEAPILLWEKSMPGITQASIDRNGYLYTADSTGSLSKWDSTGRPLAIFQAKAVIRPDLLEAWTGLKIFCFYKQQKMLVLDRFLTGDEPIDLPIPDGSFASLMTQSQDGNLWLWDLSDFALKKINPANKEPLLSNPLAQILRKRYEPVFMREYENRLYLTDTSQTVLCFDNGGNFLFQTQPNALAFGGVKNPFFSFYQSWLVFAAKDNLLFFHPYKQHHKTVSWPGCEASAKLLITASRLYLVTTKKIQAYKYRPGLWSLD